MGALFNRDVLLNVGGVQIRSRSPDGEARPTLRVTFRVELTNTRATNSAEVSIFNLEEQTRSILKFLGTVSTILEAGYVDERPQIFAGDLDVASNTRQGTEWVTALQSRDGGAATTQKRISASFKKIKISEVLRTLANELGVGLGNAAQKALEGAKRGNVEEFTSGIVLQGNVYDKLDQIARQMGLQLSVQQGQIQLLEPNETVGNFEPLLRSPRPNERGTGLIGSPEVGENGIVTARAQIQPGLLPGGAVVLDGVEIQGRHRIERAVYLGDTWGSDWYADLELKPL